MPLIDYELPNIRPTYPPLTPASAIPPCDSQGNDPKILIWISDNPSLRKTRVEKLISMIPDCPPKYPSKLDKWANCRDPQLIDYYHRAISRCDWSHANAYRSLNIAFWKAAEYRLEIRYAVNTLISWLAQYKKIIGDKHLLLKLAKTRYREVVRRDYVSLEYEYPQNCRFVAVADWLIDIEKMDWMDHPKRQVFKAARDAIYSDLEVHPVAGTLVRIFSELQIMEPTSVQIGYIVKRAFRDIPATMYDISI